jgi:hypothetical protein
LIIEGVAHLFQPNLVLVVTERDVTPGVSKGFVYAPGEPKIGTFRNENVEFLPKN